MKNIIIEANKSKLKPDLYKRLIALKTLLKVIENHIELYCHRCYNYPIISNGGVIMKNLKKLVLVGISAVMTASLFTGCSYEGNKLSDAFTKTQKITSLESKTELGLRFSAENLSAEEQKQMNEVIPMMNNSNMTINSKVNQSGDGKTAKMQSDVAIKLGDTPMNIAVWADVNDNNGFKEIIKMPPTEKDKINGKEYVVLDSSKMGVPTDKNADFQKIVEDMQKKLSEIMIANMATFDPGFKLVTDKGFSYVNSPDGVKYIKSL